MDLATALETTESNIEDVTPSFQSENVPTGAVVRVPNAWPPLVPDAWFRRADRRLAERGHPGPRDAQLRAALNRWAWTEPVTPAVLRGAQPLETILAESPNALHDIVEFVAGYGVIQFSSNSTLNGIFDLEVLCSFPNTQKGRAAWEFPIVAKADGHLLLGLSPAPDVRVVAMFFLVGRRMKRLPRILRPGLVPGSFELRNGVTVQTLHEKIDRHLFATDRAEQTFLKAIADASVISTEQISRQLDWPEGVAYGVYSRLRERGVSLPELAWRTKRFVKFSCEECGQVEWRSIRGAMRTKIDLCKRCGVRAYKGARRIQGVCVICGAERNLSRSGPKPTRKRPNNKCRHCSALRNVVAARNGSVRSRSLKRAAYRSLVAVTVDFLASRGAVAFKPCSGRAPTDFGIPIAGRRKKVRIRLHISRAETAARLLTSSTLLRKVARKIVQKARCSDAWPAAEATLLTVDLLMPTSSS